MKALVDPSRIKGSLNVPPSKSAMQRACAAALLRTGKTEIKNPGYSADDKAALDIIRRLGADVSFHNDLLVIRSEGVRPDKDEIHCGESGLSVRMFTPIASLSPTPLLITGEGSLVKRPMNFFDEFFSLVNVDFQSSGGFLPFRLRGPLIPVHIQIDASLSSQFLTGILFAYSAAGASNISIEVSNLASRPYIDLTLQVMKAFGMKLPSNDSYQRFSFGPQANIEHAEVVSYEIEGDWSAASCLLVAGAISGEISLRGLDLFSLQADKKMLEALMQAGCFLSMEEKQVTVKKNRLKPFHFNAVHSPDLFPALVALACYCEGTSVIEGVSRLQHKESERALVLRNEFEKLGIRIKIQDDLMLIEGGKIINAPVSSHDDHRIAMALAVAALGGKGRMEIEGAEAVSKSYPIFWQDLQKINAAVSLINN